MNALEVVEIVENSFSILFLIVGVAFALYFGARLIFAAFFKSFDDWKKRRR